MKISLAFQRQSIHSACDAVPAALLNRESSTAVVMIYMPVRKKDYGHQSPFSLARNPDH